MITKGKKSKLKYIFPLLLMILWSCESEKTQGSLEAYITEAKIDHVINKREDCRFSKIYFTVEIHNKSDTEKVIKLPIVEDYCDRETNTENLIWLVDDSFENSIFDENKKILAVSDRRDSLILLKPAEKYTTELVGLFKVFTLSLKKMNEVYQPYLTQSSSIRYTSGKDTLFFTNKENFKLTLFLDDTLTTQSDSIRYTKERRPPF